MATKINPIEQYFEWYLDELKKYGFIKSYEREADVFTVLKPKKHKQIKRYQSKKNIETEFTLLQGLKYTYDYRIIWEEKGLLIFTEVYKKDVPFEYGVPVFISHLIPIKDSIEIVSYIDVKPHASAARFSGSLTSFTTFPIVQKILFELWGIYINKVVPINQGKHGVSSALFAKTFTPNRYLFTDGGSTLRKIPFNKRNINDFVKTKQKAIDEAVEVEVKKENSNKDLFS